LALATVNGITELLFTDSGQMLFTATLFGQVLVAWIALLVAVALDDS
jgi:hypothetical protein